MKLLFSSLFALALLSSCGHHGNNNSNNGNGNGGGLFGSQVQGGNGSCPSLNGRYGTQQDNMVIHTQQNGNSL